MKGNIVIDAYPPNSFYLTLASITPIHRIFNLIQINFKIFASLSFMLGIAQYTFRKLVDTLLLMVCLSASSKQKLYSFRNERSCFINYLGTIDDLNNSKNRFLALTT